MHISVSGSDQAVVCVGTEAQPNLAYLCPCCRSIDLTFWDLEIALETPLEPSTEPAGDTYGEAPLTRLS